MPASMVFSTKTDFINVTQYSIKKSNPFTCIGWVSQVQVPSTNAIVLLAVSDTDGVVLDSPRALRFEVLPDGSDFRLRFSHSISKKVAKTTSVRLEDTNWHFLSYVCTGEGLMRYYVDGIYLPPEDGSDPDGVSYTTAWSRYVRQGGGRVWCPFLSEPGQAVSLYNWRFASGLQLHQQWLQELMAIDSAILNNG